MSPYFFLAFAVFFQNKWAIICYKITNWIFWFSLWDKHVKSKTDVLRDGNIAVIGRTGNDTCPVKLLERYLLQAKINPLSAEDIFRSIHVSHQAVYKL